MEHLTLSLIYINVNNYNSEAGFIERLFVKIHCDKF